MHHRVQALADGIESSKAQKIQGCGPHRGQDTGAIAAVAVFVLVELGVADPVPAFNAPALPDQAQQGFWGGAQAGKEQMPRFERLDATAAADDHFNDPGRPWPVRLDVLRCLFGPQHPGDLTAVTDLVMRCGERDLTLPQ